MKTRKRILITGGSGFIGTNLIEFLLKRNLFDVLNIDIVPPQNSEHFLYWKQIDICQKKELYNVIKEFSPSFVIHLAAKTDLRGKSIEDYRANTEGLENLLACLEKTPTIERCIFTSSMYVCEPGYIPSSFEDYRPHTIYGESKVEGEKIIKQANLSYTWAIIRPTSIWGPWFGEPYIKFFQIIKRRMYFHLGQRACKKNYGYVSNTIEQILAILFSEAEQIHKQVFYLGDYLPYDISVWADEIAKEYGLKIPTIPFGAFKFLAKLGDCLKLFGIIFPMTSFRLKNMTTDNVLPLTLIRRIIPELPITRQEANKRTIDWLKKHKSF